MAGQKIPGDRLVLGLFSGFRTLVIELSKTDALDLDRYLQILDETADAHESSGDPNHLAAAIRAIRDHIGESADEEDGQAH